MAAQFSSKTEFYHPMAEVLMLLPLTSHQNFTLLLKIKTFHWSLKDLKLKILATTYTISHVRFLISVSGTDFYSYASLHQ